MTTRTVPLRALLERPIAFQRVYRVATGSTVAAVFLSQALYWTERLSADRDGWFYKTQAEWERETGLSRREQETARKVLRERGILSEKRIGTDATIWFRVEQDALADAIWRCASPDGGTVHQEMAEPGIPDGGKRHPQMDDSASSYKETETTTENTAETTHSAPASGRGAGASDLASLVGEVAAVARGAAGAADAGAFHGAVESALAALGWDLRREAEVADRGDGRDGRVDLVGRHPCGARVAMELDRDSPREKSIIKLRQIDADVRLVLLRGGVSWRGATPAGIDAVIAAGAATQTADGLSTATGAKRTTLAERFERFERFWAGYPKKVGKQAAWRAWERTKPDEALTTRMIAAVEEQIGSPQWLKEQGQYIPNPATWLNQGRWEDEAGIELPEPVDHRPAYRRLRHGFNPVTFLAPTPYPVTPEQIARLDADEPIKEVLSDRQNDLCRREMQRLRNIHEFGLADGY